MTSTPRAKIDFAPVDIVREELGGGAFVLRAAEQLGAYPANICVHLHRWAEEAGTRTFLAERGADGEWIRLSYQDALAQTRAVAQALLNRGITPEHPVMILSDNSIAHALMQLGCMYAGIPVSPISPAYSLMSQDHAKLKHIAGLIEPRLVFVQNGQMFAKALNAIGLDNVEVVAAAAPADGMATTAFDDLIATPAGPEVDAAFAKVGPDTTGKILFTSGSTGLPKGVINTQKMLCANMQMAAQVWPFITRRPPVIVDWLPWNHTFGGNHNFNLMLSNGGTLYIDAGKPAPGLIEKTVAAFREISPTLVFNVPRGYDMLIPYLEQDKALRDKFFAELDVILYAAAALPQNLWDRLEALSAASRGEIVVMVSSWGSTETAPLVTTTHFQSDQAALIGVPAPGVELKMVPNGSKLEMRVRGDNITPGYYKQDDLTAEAFDEDGFYKIGDAGLLADPDNPNAGIIFNGRVAEDFKLLTGTWVNAGKLRVLALQAGAPIIQDAVVAGHNRDEIGLLVFPNPAGCAKVAGMAPDTPMAELIANDKVRAELAALIGAYNKEHTASSERVARLLLLEAPPNLDANEITDKGYINQRAVLEFRAGEVEKLYSDDPAVIVP